MVDSPDIDGSATLNSDSPTIDGFHLDPKPSTASPVPVRRLSREVIANKPSTLNSSSERSPNSGAKSDLSASKRTPHKAHLPDKPLPPTPPMNNMIAHGSEETEKSTSDSVSHRETDGSDIGALVSPRQRSFHAVEDTEETEVAPVPPQSPHSESPFPSFGSGSSVGKKDMHYEVLNELLYTEKSFCRHLDIILEEWYPIMAGIVERKDVDMIFLGMQNLRDGSSRLIAALSTIITKPLPEQDVGHRLIQAKILDNFITHCTYESLSVRRLTELRSTNQTLDLVLEEKRKSCERCERLGLESFLIKPIQRITRYPLLLKALLEHTPTTHPDYSALKQAHEMCAKTSAIINEQQYLLQLQESFETADGEPLQLLDQTGRRYLMEGTFKKVKIGEKVCRNCTVLLFSDSVIVAKKRSTQPLRYSPKTGRIALTDVLIFDEKTMGDGHYAFSLVGYCKDIERITISTSGDDEKKLWMEEITAAIIA
eukprot:TRINITY_DN3736_c0_g1_i3.p1 TRINITY_DN3736_c0_g1~~TRINITY_DN3736_c0_g1_i3.p1  ORF type:complete len:483 (-),score=54.30 TRINITY_DN3736_c0_g1_i3:72-1520(-)